jgi:hypothetical protein
MASCTWPEVGTASGVTVAVMVVPHAGKSRLLATDGFLVDGFMHVAEVGTTSGVTVAVTVVPHAGDSCLLVGGLVLEAAVSALFGVPLVVAVLASSHRPRLPSAIRRTCGRCHLDRSDVKVPLPTRWRPNSLLAMAF